MLPDNGDSGGTLQLPSSLKKLMGKVRDRFSSHD